MRKKRNNLSWLTEQSVLDLFEKYGSWSEISRQYGIPLTSLYAVRKRLGGRVTPPAHQLYEKNESFFDSIDTEEKAYWLGFISGDGYVVRTTAIGVSLNPIDTAHLEKFKKIDWVGCSNYNREKVSQTNEKISLASNNIGSFFEDR